VQAPTLRQSEDLNDTSSEFSGYSMVTPSATSTSELEESKPLPHPQAQEKVGVEGHEVSHVPQLGAGGFNIDIDASNDQQPGESDSAAKEPSEDDTNVLHTGCESGNQKSKLIGIVITFEHGAYSDEGHGPVRYIGDHLAVRLGSQVGKANVLSIEGQGRLEVDVTPETEPQVHLHSDDHRGEHVVTLRCIDEDCKPGDQPQASARIVSTMILPFSHSMLDPVDTPPIMPEDCSLFEPTDLQKARTLRALLDSKIFACSSIPFEKTAQPAAKSPATISSDIAPTLSQLIDIAKIRIHRELTKHEHFNSFDSPESTGVGQKTSKIEIRSLKGKVAMRLDRENLLIFSTSALLLTVVSLVLCIVGMSAKTQGHCVGIWLGS
jgi:hypothetical protein